MPEIKEESHSKTIMKTAPAKTIKMTPKTGEKERTETRARKIARKPPAKPKKAKVNRIVSTRM